MVGHFCYIKNQLNTLLYQLVNLMMKVKMSTITQSNIKWGEILKTIPDMEVKEMDRREMFQLLKKEVNQATVKGIGKLSHTVLGWDNKASNRHNLFKPID